MTALSGSYPFTAKVTDSSGHGATLPLTLTVSAALTIVTSELPEADTGTPYSDSLSASGGVPPYQWSVFAGALPSGIQLQSSSGVINGTTAASGSYSFTAKVTDSYGQIATVAFVLTVSPAALPTLSVSNAGTGSGIVISSPAGISCPPTCTANFTGTVTLAQTTAPGSSFQGWTATGCSGTGPTCSVVMNTNQVVNANFAYLTVDNTYCPPNGVPTWGTMDGPATLPTECFLTLMTDTPTSGGVVSVTTTADLISALASASCGEIITLQAGNTFTGHFTIPALPCPSYNYLWIVTSALTSLPPEGARYATAFTQNGVTLPFVLPQFGPCYSGVTSLPGRPPFSCPATPGTYTAQLISPDAEPVLTFTTGSSGVRIIGIEITRTPSTGYNAQLIDLGNIGNISNIIFDRIWCHGDENQDETETCFDASAASYVAAVDGYFNDFYCLSPGTCTDSHPIIHGLNFINSTQENVLKIVNSFLEGAGENFLSGGGESSTVPANFEIRLNEFFKPLLWNPSDPSYAGGVGGHPQLAKNLFEIKNAQLVLLEGNEFNNTWGGFSQSGEAWKIIAVNQSGKCPVCEDVNITARYNTVNTAEQFLFGLGTIDTAGYYPFAENSISVHDNVADNLGYETCNECETNASIVGMWEQPTITTTTQVFSYVSVVHNTMVSVPNPPTIYGVLGLSGPPSPSALQQHNLHFDNNMTLAQSPQGTGNVVGGTASSNCAAGADGGSPMITSCWYLDSTVSGNCFIDNGSVPWPDSNVTSVADQASAYANWNLGNGGDYAVAAGPCKGAATDGRDPGADLTELAAVLSGQPVPSAATPTVSLANFAGIK